MVMLNKIVTKQGDQGQSCLCDGIPRPKSDLIFAAIGDLDETNAMIGWAREALCTKSQPELIDQCEEIQQNLFNCGAMMSVNSDLKREDTPEIDIKAVQSLEKHLNNLNEHLTTLPSFVLPGGCEANARLHIARCVCRRAERSLVRLHKHEKQDECLLKYLNRLSDWCFVAARYTSLIHRCPERLWRSG
jgi:cob(I)alamin adenosyltransferase